jgi:uncharacterized Rmd1/YagE family protein
MAELVVNPIPVNSEIKPCAAFCLAQSFDIYNLIKALADTYPIKIIKGVLLIEDNGAWSIVFGYGAVVHWAMSDNQQAELHDVLLRYADNPLAVIEEDHFTFAVHCGATRVIEDHIEITSDDDPMLLLSFSQGMAQSIKLAAFETHALKTINETRYIPKFLAEHGKINLSRRQIARIRGQLFLAKNDIIVNFDLLDTPDFFWEYPEYEEFYAITAKYLEINPRTDVLSKKLETIHELFQMMADEQNYRHSSILEWIIIWLIAIEITMTLVDKLF